jgi:phosphotransferase system enzyme I (PtsI)
VSPDAVDGELERLANAVQRAEQELETVQTLAPASLTDDSGAIFEAQALMLRDDEVLGAIRDRIREERLPAGAAVQEVMGAYRARLEESGDAHLRTGADDLRDLERRLLRALQRTDLGTTVDADSIVVAQVLSPTDLLRFGQHDLRGAVMATGGPTSHVAIVARALSLPLLVGVGDSLDAVASGDRVILDGTEGRMIVQPAPETVEEYRPRSSGDAPSSPTEDVPTRPPHTSDGRAITLRANVGLEAELDVLGNYGADGIGLLRTELMMQADAHAHTITEDQQVPVYRRAVEAAGSSGATIRLFDLGGDAREGMPPQAREDNPFLGWRGIRVLLDRPDELLRPQLRALLRANRHGPLRVLLPMVTDVAEVRRVRELLEAEADRLAAEGVPYDPDLPLGIMVEVPAVALRAQAFTDLVDFFSVGTNDLTQYVLAVDRGNERVGTRHDALHPAVLGLLLRVVEAGRMARCPVEVCGEIAGDVQAVPVLIGLGLDTLSVSPSSLPAVRRMVESIEYEAAKDLARDVLQAEDAQRARRQAREWIEARRSSDGTGTADDRAADTTPTDPG